MQLPFVKMNEILPAPRYAKPGDAGLDLCASDHYIVEYGRITIVKLGVGMEIPPGHVGLLCPRSGLASKEGVTMVNSPGVIDSGYRGEVCAPLIRLIPGSLEIHPGLRVAQLLVVPVATVDPIEVEALSASARGAGGFGHTGA